MNKYHPVNSISDCNSDDPCQKDCIENQDTIISYNLQVDKKKSNWLQRWRSGLARLSLQSSIEFNGLIRQLGCNLRSSASRFLSSLRRA